MFRSPLLSPKALIICAARSRDIAPSRASAKRAPALRAVINLMRPPCNPADAQPFPGASARARTREEQWRALSSSSSSRPPSRYTAVCLCSHIDQPAARKETQERPAKARARRVASCSRGTSWSRPQTDRQTDISSRAFILLSVGVRKRSAAIVFAFAPPDVARARSNLTLKWSRRRLQESLRACFQAKPPGRAGQVGRRLRAFEQERRGEENRRGCRPAPAARSRSRDGNGNETKHNCLPARRARAQELAEMAIRRQATCCVSA